MLEVSSKSSSSVVSTCPVHHDVELTHLARHDGTLNLTKCTNITVCGMHLQDGVEYVCMWVEYVGVGGVCGCVVCVSMGKICGCGWSMWLRVVCEYG